MIDSHCHLFYDYDGKTTEDLIQEAQKKGVKKLVSVSTEPKDFTELQTCSEKHQDVFHTIGIHPHGASAVTSDQLDEMKKYLSHPKCLAVGEIGLDYYYKNSDEKDQKIIFEKQLQIALEFQKPIVVHTRDAEEDTHEILLDWTKKLSFSHSRGIIHCFTGTLPFAKKMIDLGFYISFSGIVTFKNAKDIQEVARFVPEDRILIETDSPYLAPVPHRGKKCEPWMVSETAAFLANLRNTDFSSFISQTEKNTYRAFQWNQPSQKS